YVFIFSISTVISIALVATNTTFLRVTGWAFSGVIPLAANKEVNSGRLSALIDLRSAAFFQEFRRDFMDRSPVPRYPALFGLKSLSADLSLRSVSRLQTE